MTPFRRLSQMLNKPLYREYAEKTFAAFANVLENSPIILPQMCVALDFYLSTPAQVVIAGDPKGEDTRAMLRELHSHHLPNKVVLFADQKEGQAFLSKQMEIIKVRAFVSTSN